MKRILIKENILHTTGSINLRNRRVLCTEVFKTMTVLNPTYMKEIFERSVSNKRPVRQNYKMNIVTPKTN